MNEIAPSSHRAIGSPKNRNWKLVTQIFRCSDGHMVRSPDGAVLGVNNEHLDA